MPEHENESEFFVFVLMPFDPEFDAVFSKLIVPTLEGNCFSVNRADSALDQENILKNIIRNISKADLVIADMTTMNPNVMYELGIAHAFSKPTVLIAQSIDDVPFDLRSYRVITYSTHFNEAEKFQEKLTEIAKQCMDGSMKFGNPVSDFLENIPSVGNDVDGSYLKIETDEESEGKNSLLTEEEGELGWLDLEVEAEESMGQIVLLMNDISEKSTVLSENIEKHTEQITQLNSEKSGGARQLQQLMLLMSSDMNQYSREVDSILPEFHELWEHYIGNFEPVLKKLNIKTDGDRKEVEGLLSAIIDSKKGVGQAVESAEFAQKSMEGLKGISRVLDRSIHHTERTIEGMAETYILGLSYIVRIENAIREKLD